MLQIEKEHKRSTLMSAKKKDLADQVMRLEHNNNVLEDTINQQVENFKLIEQQTWIPVLERAAEEIENLYGRETELSEQIRKLIG